MLVPLDEQFVAQIEPWWQDPETDRRLGGYPPGKALQLARQPPEEFRGRKVTNRSALVVLQGARPVALVDFESYEDGSAGLGLVVDPELRNQGIGRTVLNLLFRSHELDGVERLFAGIEAGNLASIRCFTSAGFLADSDQPDEEGIIYFSRLR